MSSSLALCCFPPVKKQTHEFHFFVQSMDNTTIIRFGFCDIQNNVLIRVISLTLRLRLITLTSTLIILDITKTSFSNCLYIIIIYKIICHQTMTSFPYAADLKKYYFVSTQLHWWCQQDLEVISSKLTVLKRLKMVLLEYDHLWEYKQTFSFKIVVWLVGNLEVALVEVVAKCIRSKTWQGDGIVPLWPK